MPFKITRQQFEAGDSIVLRQVLSTSSALKVGDTVVGRGQYRLESHSRATLGLFLTMSAPNELTPISPKQRTFFKAGDGPLMWLNGELPGDEPSDSRGTIALTGSDGLQISQSHA